jgi:META domain
MFLRSRLAAYAVMVLLLGTLAACGNAPGAPAPEPRKTDPELISSLPTSPAPDQPAPDQTAGSQTPDGSKTEGPKPVCEGGPLGCRRYKSTGGRDATGELAWLKSKPLEISMVYVNDTWTVGVKTPCNHLGVEVKVQGERWIHVNTIMTAMGCPSLEGSYEDWTIKLFKQPVTWKLNGTTLVLHNSHGTVEFRDAGPIPYM